MSLVLKEKYFIDGSYDKTNGSFWLDNKSIPAVVPTPGGETIIYMYANKYITKF